MRYPGGKGKCFHQIINLMPEHTVYIETHLGGGAVLRHKKPANSSIGIDIDERVIARFKTEYPALAQYEQHDAVTFLESYPFTGTELIYCDPPYPRSSRRKQNIYRFDYKDSDHERLLSTLIELPCMVMVSSYENVIYASNLKAWNQVKFPNKTHTGVRDESLWLNFSEPDKVHDTRYLGSTFRERQSIRRKQERLRKKIGSLSAPERQSLMQWLSETYSMKA